MTVSDTLANTSRAAHDVCLAAWLGGAMFGKFAHNPALEKISSHSERGSVTNAAWNGYNPSTRSGSARPPSVGGSPVSRRRSPRTCPAGRGACPAPRTR